MERKYSPVFGTALFVCLALSAGIPCPAQAQQGPQTAAANASVNASLGDLQSQVQELKQMVMQLQQETTASRAEISKLRQELQAQRAESYAAATAVPADNDHLAANSA